MATEDVTLRVILDVCILCLFVVPGVVFKVAVTPFQRGFYCNDESIAHPYHDDTIPLWIVIIVGIIVPVILMIPIEICRYRYKSRRDRVWASRQERYAVCSQSVHPYIVGIYTAVGAFLFAMATTWFATDIIKFTIGRLRPHFLDVCRPRWDSFNCKDQQGVYRYVVDEGLCTGDPHKVKNARMSHPSGHSSMSMLCAVYFVLYMQSRFTWSGSRLLRPLVQGLALYCAIYVCASRVSDYKHHWSDVLGGGMLGTVVALLVAIFVSNLFARPNLTDIAVKITQLSDGTSGKLRQMASENQPKPVLKERYNQAVTED